MMLPEPDLFRERNNLYSNFTDSPYYHNFQNYDLIQMLKYIDERSQSKKYSNLKKVKKCMNTVT